MSPVTLAAKSTVGPPGTLPAARLAAAGVVTAVALAALALTGSGRLVLLGAIGLALG